MTSSGLYRESSHRPCTAIIEAIRQPMAPPEKPHREIGFHVQEMAPPYRTMRRR